MFFAPWYDYFYRQKYHNVESEASKGSEVLKERLGTLKEKVQEALDEASKTDIAKKAGNYTTCIVRNSVHTT